MDDTQLNSLRGEPSPAFTARLQQSLREHDASTSRIEWPGVRSIAAPVLIVLAIVGLLSVPAVRASAQSFLALFRVVNSSRYRSTKTAWSSLRPKIWILRT